MLERATTCHDPPLHISGYSVVEELYRGSRTVVYRAIEASSQRSVIIKLLRHDHPSFTDLLQFRNQYTITKNLTIPGIVYPYSLESYRNSYAIVMEDFGGISLRNYVQAQPILVADVLEIALQLTEILHDLYQARVIHKDIKPANILIHPESKQIKLIDFSIASLLPKETQEIKNPSRLEGTLAYLAPEQTGRMNRGIDYRADFYALGVTLFELLTGQLPFQSPDPMQLVHCHLAKQPPRVHSLYPEIPITLSNIVSKLMAKNAEDRYQSALGLKHDLEKCLSQWQQTGSITEFALGTQDISDRFLIPEKLYGREQEVAELLNAFNRVSEGGSELMLVAGFSGLGKTTVVNEIHKPIARQRGYFIKGKFDQFSRRVPFSGFVQAFRSLMSQLLGESDSSLANWKERMLTAVGTSGRVITELIPELELIIGSQPPIPELSGTSAQNRFNLLFGKFMRVFTTQDHPLVIFLDDLQWADSASLNLLQLVMSEAASEPETSYLLVLGAYRDNEVGSAHPLMLTLEHLNQQGILLHTLTLAPLKESDITDLVADTLRCSTAMATPLAHLIYQHTQGNPFFATQFLQGLHEDNHIVFDSQAGYWQCDLAQIRQLALTNDVVEFMVGRLQKLPEATQAILKSAACISTHFDLETLAIVSEQTQADVAESLWPALQVGIVLPAHQLYKFFYQNLPGQQLSENSDNLSYCFSHDRVRQAAYSLIPDDQKAAIHYRIGQLLLTHLSSETQEEQIFEIIGHLNFVSRLIVTPAERIKLARLNLIAGQKAKNATAYKVAVDYLTTGIQFLPQNAWEQHYDLTLALHTAVVESACLNTDFEQMEQWAAVVLQQARTLLDTIDVQQTRLIGTRAQGRLLEALQIGLQVLERMGITFPEQPTQAAVAQAFGMMRPLWIERSPLDLLNLPMMTDANHLAAMQMMSWLVPCAYAGNPTLMSLLIFKQVELSIQHGNCPLSIFAYADFGLILCGVIGDISSGHNFGQLALQLLDQLQEIPAKSRSWYVIHTYIQHWKAPLRESIPCLQEAFQSGMEVGEVDSASLNAVSCCCSSYNVGQALTDIVKRMDAYRQTVSELRQATPQYFLDIYQQTVLNLLGRNEVPTQLIGTVFNAAESLPSLQAANNRSVLFFVHFHQTVLSYLFGNYQQAVEQSILGAQYLDGGIGTFTVPLYFFYDSLVQLALYPTVLAETQSHILQKVETSQSKLQGWAALAPFNHQHRWALIEAERHFVLGNRSDAIEFYDRAIADAKANEFIQDQALANERAARFYLNWGKEKVAASYMQEAYYGYAHWEAKAKVEQLVAAYPQLLEPILRPRKPSRVAGLARRSFVQSTSSSKRSSNSNIGTNTTLDLVSILKASQIISSTIEIEELLGQLTQILLHNSGSDRCAIMLCEPNGQIQIRAIATLDMTDLCAISLEEAQQLPLQLIQYVRSSKEKIVTHHPDDALPLVDRDLDTRRPASILCLPLMDRSQLRGILYLENQTTGGVFHTERLATLNLLATQSAISLENARLYQQAQDYVKRLEDSQVKLLQSEKMATHDPLTGLPNRRLLMDRLEQAIAHCHRSEQTFGLIFFDLDGFKQVNDTYGHQVGDELLMQVTQRLKACMRGSDEFFRLGGDEFVILVEQIKSINSIIKFAEKLLASLQNSFAIKNYEVTVGGSFGIKMYDQLHAQTVSNILADADNAMYQAKKRKNCIVLHESK